MIELLDYSIGVIARIFVLIFIFGVGITIIWGTINIIVSYIRNFIAEEQAQTDKKIAIEEFAERNLKNK